MYFEQPTVSHHGASGQLIRVATDYQNQCQTFQCVIVDLHHPSRVLSARLYLFVDPVSMIDISRLREIHDRIGEGLSSFGNDNLHLLHGLYYFVEFQSRATLHIHPSTSFVD